MANGKLMTELDMVVNYAKILDDLNHEDMSKMLQVGDYVLINVDEVIPELKHSIAPYTHTVRFIEAYGQYKTAYVFILNNGDKDKPLFKKATADDFRTICRAMTRFELDHGADKELIKLHFDIATYQAMRANQNKTAIKDRYHFTYKSALQHKKAHDTKVLKAGLADNTPRKNERNQQVYKDFRAYRK